MLLVRSWHVMCSLRLHQCLRLSQRNLSLLSVEEWESSQREVVTDSPGQVEFPSWQLTLHDLLSDDWPTLSMRTAC